MHISEALTHRRCQSPTQTLRDVSQVLSPPWGGGGRVRSQLSLGKAIGSHAKAWTRAPAFRHEGRAGPHRGGQTCVLATKRGPGNLGVLFSFPRVSEQSLSHSRLSAPVQPVGRRALLQRGHCHPLSLSEANGDVISEETRKTLVASGPDTAVGGCLNSRGLRKSTQKGPDELGKYAVSHCRAGGNAEV